jgi:hypothetical protein
MRHDAAKEAHAITTRASAAVWQLFRWQLPDQSSAAETRRNSGRVVSVSEFNKVDWFWLIGNAAFALTGLITGHSSVVIALNSIMVGAMGWKLAVAIYGKRRKAIAWSKAVDGLSAFVDRIKAGEPVHVTTVVRHETPDGPMHTFEPREVSLADLYDTDR